MTLALHRFTPPFYQQLLSRQLSLELCVHFQYEQLLCTHNQLLEVNAAASLLTYCL